MLELNESHHSQEINLNVGDMLEITLAENATTGFIWDIVTLDTAFLQLIVNDYLTTETAIGASGIRRLRFRTLSAGQTNLALKYWQPWQAEIATEKTYVLHIIIQ